MSKTKIWVSLGVIGALPSLNSLDDYGTRNTIKG